MVGQPEMEGRGDETGGIGRTRKIITEFAVDEIHHTLCRGGLLHIALLPTGQLQLLLISHHLKWVVSLDILGTQFHHHSAIGPLTASVARTHSVDHYLALACGCRDDETSGTHAEGIDASLIDLGDEGIFGCGKILAPAVFVVILYAVDEFGRMLKSHAYRQTLCLDIHSTLGKITIDITRTVTCGKDDGTTKLPLLTALDAHCLDAHNGVAIKKKTGHACEMVHLTATSQYRVAHVLDDTGKTVGANMGMSIAEYIH